MCSSSRPTSARMLLTLATTSLPPCDSIDLEGIPHRLLDEHPRVEGGLRVLKDDLEIAPDPPERFSL